MKNISEILLGLLLFCIVALAILHVQNPRMIEQNLVFANALLGLGGWFILDGILDARQAYVNRHWSKWKRLRYVFFNILYLVFGGYLVYQGIQMWV